VASFALRGALVHLYFFSLPIDLQVVVLEPGISEDHALLSKAGDSKEYPLRVGFVIEDYIHHFRDLTCLIGGAVHIVHWYGTRYTPGTNTFCMVMGIKRFDHKTKVKARLEKQNLQIASQLCTKQVGTREINQIIESLLKVNVQRITKTYQIET